MDKYKLIPVVLLAILLANVATPAFSVRPAPNYEAQINTLSQTLTDDSIDLNRAIETTTTMTKTVNIEGLEANVVATRYDIVDFNGTNYIKASSSISIQGVPLLFIQTPAIPREMIEMVNKTPTSPEASTTAEYTPETYIWDQNVTFISKNSRPLHVAYDHMFNAPEKYGPVYDIPPDSADPTWHQGRTVHIGHLPKHTINDIRNAGTIIYAIMAFLAPIIIKLAIAPELIATKVAAALLAMVEGILLALEIGFLVFVEYILKTENDDGWMYLWGAGHLGIFHWCYLSFGSMRDIGWLVFGASPPDSGPAIDYVDNFVIMDTPGIGLTFGGLGNNSYGCHSYLDSSIYPTCYVANNGTPIQGIEVVFTLEFPDGQSFTFDPAYTNANGIAMVGFMLNPSGAPQGIYYISAVAAGTLQDITAFTYKCCLLTLAHTYDMQTVYIGVQQNITEGVILEITVDPPEGYWLAYYIYNWYWMICDNPAVIPLYDDCFLIAVLWDVPLTIVDIYQDSRYGMTVVVIYNYETGKTSRIPLDY